MKMNGLLFIISFFAVALSYQLNRQYIIEKKEKEKIKIKYDSLLYETQIKEEYIRQCENAVKVWEKEDPTVTMRWDLLINGISGVKK
jgi:capsular polysaccharide biosynthesis protein